MILNLKKNFYEGLSQTLLNELKIPTEYILTLCTCPRGKVKTSTKILQTPQIIQLLDKKTKSNSNKMVVRVNRESSQILSCS